MTQQIIKFDEQGNTGGPFALPSKWENIDNPTLAMMLAAGFTEYRAPVCDSAKYKLGGYEFTGKCWTRAVVPLEADDYFSRRQQIEAEIYQTCKGLNDQISERYSQSESAGWAEDRAAYRAGNWGHFTIRAGSLMTGEQYAKSRVGPKIEAGGYFVDQNIGKRTDLLVSLAATPDEELHLFDHRSTWDNQDDYAVPPPSEVDPSWWQKMITAIKWWEI